MQFDSPVTPAASRDWRAAPSRNGAHTVTFPLEAAGRDRMDVVAEAARANGERPGWIVGIGPEEIRELTITL